MTHTLILGSRIYAPLTDVDEQLRTLPTNSSVTTFGTSDVALRAEATAKVLRFTVDRKPLETTRKQLLDAAATGAEVWLFVARDPETKQPTEGMAGIQHLLNDKGIAFRVISTDLPGKVCELITDLRHAVNKALSLSESDFRQERRRIVLGEKALKLAVAVADERDRYDGLTKDGRLKEAMHYGVGDAELDDRFLRWLRCYECLCDALNDAQRLLTPQKVAA